jgi:hypothetical protein
MARRGRIRRPIDRGLLVASLAIALGVVALGYGVSISLTGDEGVDYPSAIERVDPVPNAVQVLSQTNVFVDLEVGYTGVLVVNGVELPTFRIGEVADVAPGRQIDVPPVTIFEPGNATLTYSPTEGAAVERFSQGIQEVEVIFWREDEGRQRASSFTWTFNVV